MRILRKGISSLLCLCMVGILLPMAVFAAGKIDQKQKVELTLHAQMDQKPLVGAKFHIYQVASVDEYAQLTITDSFKSYPISLEETDDKSWVTLASTLEGYVQRDNVKAQSSGKTEKDGTLHVSSEDGKISQGLYLVIGDRHTQEKYYYDATPFLILLPSQDLEKNEWAYEAKVEVKYRAEKIPEKPETVTRKVLKKWVNRDKDTQAPKEVTVQLLKNGKVSDTVVLNEKNDWRHTWKDLDSKSQWKVVEKEVKGYQVSIKQEGITFVVTNTYIPKQTSTPPGTKKPPMTTLPQTGQLWWPVPCLLCLGVLFLVIGVYRRRER